MTSPSLGAQTGRELASAQVDGDLRGQGHDSLLWLGLLGISALADSARPMARITMSLCGPDGGFPLTRGFWALHLQGFPLTNGLMAVMAIWPWLGHGFAPTTPARRLAAVGTMVLAMGLACMGATWGVGLLRRPAEPFVFALAMVGSYGLIEHALRTVSMHLLGRRQA